MSPDYRRSLKPRSASLLFPSPPRDSPTSLIQSHCRKPTTPPPPPSKALNQSVFLLHPFTKYEVCDCLATLRLREQKPHPISPELAVTPLRAPPLPFAATPPFLLHPFTKSELLILEKMLVWFLFSWRLKKMQPQQLGYNSSRVYLELLADFPDRRQVENLNWT